MSTSLIDTLMSAIDPATLGSLASKLGESKDSVRSGLEGGSATMLAALASKATDTGFMGQVLGLLGNPGNGSIASTVASMATGGGGGDLASKFLSMLFGSQQSGIASAIGRAAGLSSGSASSLLGMAAPLLMSVLGQRVSSGGLGAAALGGLLSSEASGLQKLLPAGVGSLIGGLPSMAAAAPEAASSSGWIWPVAIGALLVAALFWYLGTGSSVKETAHEAAKTATEHAASATTAVSDAAKSAWAALGEFFKRKLPNGFELSIPKLGVENRLIDFIEDTTKVVDKTTWFDFDRLLFDTGSATLRPESQEQLKNISEVLKAFPKVNIKIGGYTDNTGDPAANMKLSTDRAKNVMDELVKLGVEPSRLTSEGYGDQHPVGDNATEEGRAKNRRISMRVTAK
ncbi:MAG: OmpA family protein [Bryobacteraceae bacterium]